LIATTTSLEQIDLAPLYLDSAMNAFWSSPTTSDLLRTVLGGEVFVHDRKLLRVTVPNFDLFLTPSHQDGWWYQPYLDFLTVWVPLVDIDRALGGLAIAHRSHHEGLRTHSPDLSKRYIVNPDAAPVGIPDDTLRDEVWLTTDFAVGDVLIFGALTVHRGLPNRSERNVRLSVDTRVERAGTAHGYLATTSAKEILESGIFLETEAMRLGR
jgi:ectoine hydroxylase-related dioxygenase (phytanoyl-CoA dioxygenase family)